MDLLLRRNQAFSYDDGTDALIDKSIKKATFNGTTIRSYAFYNCIELESLNAPNITSIGSYAFSGCSSLTNADFQNVTTIGANAFEYCSSVEDFTNITDDLFPLISEWPNTGFKNCTQIQSVHTSRPINSYTFQACTSLKTAVINQDGTKSAFFNNCTAMTHLDAGPLFRYLGVNTVGGCSNLSTIILRKTNTTNYIVSLAGTYLGGTPFAQGGSGGTIYIPKVWYDHLGDGTAYDYKAANNWSTYDGYGTITWAQIEGSQYEHYYADGTPISA